MSTDAWRFMQALAAKRDAFARGVQAAPEVIAEILRGQAFAQTLEEIDALPEVEE